MDEYLRMPIAYSVEKRRMPECVAVFERKITVTFLVLLEKIGYHIDIARADC
jgi:hypothetical protein